MQYMRTLAVLVVALIRLPVEAGQNWVGGGGNSNWTNGANWSPVGSPTSGNSADLYFANSNGNYTSYNDYLGWVSWRNIDFAAGFPFVLTSAPTASIDLYGRIYNGSGNTATCSFANISLQADVQFYAYGGALAVGAANIYTNGKTLLFRGAASNARPVYLEPNTVISGGGKVRIDDLAMLYVRANQAYTGNTEIDFGRLVLDGGAIGGSSVLYLGNGGTGYASRSAVLSVASPVGLASRIVVNKADTGTGIGTGYRILECATDSNLTISCPIELNGRLDFRQVYSSRVAEFTGNINDGSDSSTNVLRDIRINYNNYSGTIKFRGNNTYTGKTEVSGGTLLMNGTHTGGDDYLVRNTGRLSGTGVITLASGRTAQIDPGATVAPGASIGSLTVNGAFTLVANNTATLEVEVGGNHMQPGVAFDLLVINGALTLNQSRLNVIPTANVQLLQEYKIISATSYNPTNNLFGKLNDMVGSNNYTNSPYNNLKYNLRYAQNDGIYLTFTSIPEPTLTALLPLCVMLCRRRR